MEDGRVLLQNLKGLWCISHTSACQRLQTASLSTTDIQASLVVMDHRPMWQSSLAAWTCCRTFSCSGPHSKPESLGSLSKWVRGKDPDAGKDWRQKEKRETEEEMVRYYHQLNAHEFEQIPGDSEGWGTLAWGSPCGHKELDSTEQMNNNNNE